MRTVMAPDSTLRAMSVSEPMLRSIVRALAAWQEKDHSALQFALVRRDRLLLTAWGGMDAYSHKHVGRESLFPILSATKGLASLAVLHLNHRGFFQWDDFVADHWPEFGIHGKERATISDVLAHRVGIPHVTAPSNNWNDRSHMEQLVESAQPLWPPGSRYGYHGGSWGILVDGLVRRWSGCRTGEVLAHILSPTARLNCLLGMPHHRVSDLIRLRLLNPHGAAPRHPRGPWSGTGGYNSPRVLSVGHSSGGAVSSAEGLALAYSLISREGQLGDTSLWTSESQRFASRARSDSRTEVPAYRPELSFSWGMGFMVHPSRQVFSSSPLSTAVAGHPGASGAIGYGDPVSQLALGFTINGCGGPRLYDRFKVLADLALKSLT